MKKIILPIDGFQNFSQVKEKLDNIFQNKEIKHLISHIKLNDIVYSTEGCLMYQKIVNYLEDSNLQDIKIFLDLKLSDTSGTNWNIMMQYIEQGLIPDILTVRECCSSTTFRKLAEDLPTVNIAVVSVLTDTSEDECMFRYGMSPVEKITHDLKKISTMCPRLIDAFVCSPQEVNYLKENFPHLKSIVPGIRDNWMQKGQQIRTMGAKQAFDAGADYLVMGSQLTKGNPDNGISPAQSIKMTIESLS